MSTRPAPDAPAPGQEHLLRLPFDQYGRYRMVQEAVAAVAGALGQPRLRLLDVGGYYQEAGGAPRLPSQQFLGQHDLTILDLPPCDLPGYVQGDGTQLQFGDASFDLVISCDTLEHIPAAQRARFINELVRTARLGVLLICPFFSPQVELAEQLLDEYIQAELNVRHAQLREHREYGLPQIDLVRAQFEADGCQVRDYPSGDLHAWLPLMLAKHYLLRHAAAHPDLHAGLDELYNRSYATLERREPSYRRLVVAARHDAAWLDAVDAAIEPTVARDATPHPGQWHELAPQVLAVLQLGLDNRREQERIQGLNDRIRQLEHRAADLEARARWLEQQAEAARARLAAVENGRVMRILRRFGRS